MFRGIENVMLKNNLKSYDRFLRVPALILVSIQISILKLVFIHQVLVRFDIDFDRILELILGICWTRQSSNVDIPGLRPILFLHHIR